MTPTPTPPHAQLMEQKYHEAMLRGWTCTGFIVRSEDLGELRKEWWEAGCKYKADPKGERQISYFGVPIYALRPSQGMEIHGSPMVVVRSEDLERMEKALAEGSALQLIGLPPGGCWAVAKPGREVPKVD